MAESANGNTGTGTSTGEGTSTTSSAPSSAAQAQEGARAGNAAAANQAQGEAAAKSEAAKGNSQNATYANAPTSPGFNLSNLNFNTETGNWDTGTPAFPGLNTSDNASKSPGSILPTDSAKNLKDALNHLYQTVMTRAFKAPDYMENYRKSNPELSEIGDRAYQDSIKKGKSQWDANWDGQQAIEQHLKDTGQFRYGIDDTTGAHWGFEGQFNKHSYNPAVTAEANKISSIADGTSKMNHTAPAAPNVNKTPAAPSSPAETGTETAVGNSEATNYGFVNRGGSVTDNGTGGTISSSLNPPSRDSSSIGLGTYNEDRANYDQDDWNRGMEFQTSSLVSDEACKSFAKRAFLERSEPFKKVRVTIIKKV